VGWGEGSKGGRGGGAKGGWERGSQGRLGEREPREGREREAESKRVGRGGQNCGKHNSQSQGSTTSDIEEGRVLQM
jgi:hypothetical protein